MSGIGHSVVAQGEHDPVDLIHVGGAEIPPGRMLRRARVYDRRSGVLHAEHWPDSIVARGYWIEFTGGEAERGAIEREVASITA